MENDDKIKDLEKQNSALKGEKDALATEKDSLVADKGVLATKVETLTQELNGLKGELETLRKFKNDTEQAAERAQKISGIKAKLVEAGIEANLDDEKEANYWLDMSDDSFNLTVSKMVELKKGAKASASVKIPNLSKTEDDEDKTEIVRRGLSKMKEGRK
jgi:DNA repair exonuclease SbcCD ATPase subunit